MRLARQRLRGGWRAQLYAHNELKAIPSGPACAEWIIADVKHGVATALDKNVSMATPTM